MVSNGETFQAFKFLLYLRKFIVQAFKISVQVTIGISKLKG